MKIRPVGPHRSIRTGRKTDEAANHVSSFCEGA